MEFYHLMVAARGAHSTHAAIVAAGVTPGDGVVDNYQKCKREWIRCRDSIDRNTACMKTPCDGTWEFPCGGCPRVRA